VTALCYHKLRTFGTNLCQCCKVVQRHLASNYSGANCCQIWHGTSTLRINSFCWLGISWRLSAFQTNTNNLENLPSHLSLPKIGFWEVGKSKKKAFSTLINQLNISKGKVCLQYKCTQWVAGPIGYTSLEKHLS
jgi:hypothetical protein